MTKRPSRAYAYVRVSSDKQVESGLSLAAQRDEILAYCIASEIEVVGIASDEGVSGGKDDSERSGLREVLTAVSTGAVDSVVVSKRDRLARDLSLAGYIATRIRKAGAELIVLDEIDVPPLTRCVLTMVAEVERLLASQRTRFALRALRERGRHVGVVPYGYRVHDGFLQVDENEYAIVDEIVAMREAGETLAIIANRLAARGVTTRRGGRWSPEQVRSILNRRKQSTQQSFEVA